VPKDSPEGLARLWKSCAESEKHETQIPKKPKSNWKQRKRETKTKARAPKSPEESRIYVSVLVDTDMSLYTSAHSLYMCFHSFSKNSCSTCLFAKRKRTRKQKPNTLTERYDWYSQQCREQTQTSMTVCTNVRSIPAQLHGALAVRHPLGNDRTSLRKYTTSQSQPISIHPQQPIPYVGSSSVARHLWRGSSEVK
jgi:hypothetical protein